MAGFPHLSRSPCRASPSSMESQLLTTGYHRPAGKLRSLDGFLKLPQKETRRLPTKPFHAAPLAPRARSGQGRPWAGRPCPGRALAPEPPAAPPAGSPGNAADAAAPTRGHGLQGEQEEGVRLLKNVRAPGEREGGAGGWQPRRPARHGRCARRLRRARPGLLRPAGSFPRGFSALARAAAQAGGRCAGRPCGRGTGRTRVCARKRRAGKQPVLRKFTCSCGCFVKSAFWSRGGVWLFLGFCLFVQTGGAARVEVVLLPCAVLGALLVGSAFLPWHADLGPCAQQGQRSLQLLLGSYQNLRAHWNEFEFKITVNQDNNFGNGGAPFSSGKGTKLAVILETKWLMRVIAHQFSLQKGKKIPSVWKVCFMLWGIWGKQVR